MFSMVIVAKHIFCVLCRSCTSAFSKQAYFKPILVQFKCLHNRVKKCHRINVICHKGCKTYVILK